MGRNKSSPPLFQCLSGERLHLCESQPIVPPPALQEQRWTFYFSPLTPHICSQQQCSPSPTHNLPLFCPASSGLHPVPPPMSPSPDPKAPPLQPSPFPVVSARGAHLTWASPDTTHHLGGHTGLLISLAPAHDTTEPRGFYLLSTAALDCTQATLLQLMDSGLCILLKTFFH